MDILPTLHTGTLIVVCTPHAAREQAARLAAELALRGPLTVLDGGNSSSLTVWQSCSGSKLPR